jgi:hypothetical protein
MMQWRRTLRKHGANARSLSRVMTAVMTLGVMLTAALATKAAAAHPLRARSAEAVQQAHGHTDRARSRSAVYKPVRRHATARRANAKAHAREAAATKPATRVNARQKAEIADAGKDRNDAAKTLTVDDFMHAAKSPTAGVPAADSSAQQGIAVKPVHAAGGSAPHAPLALVEAAPATTNAAKPAVVGAADLVGAPLRRERIETRRMRMTAAEAALAEPSREELAAEVEQPVVLPGLYRNGRLVVPRPLKGSREVLVHQNLVADDEGLSRIQDSDDMQRMRAEKQLVDLQETAGLRVNPELTGDRRCARPWTVQFAQDIARSYYARFHEPLQVNSAARTVAYQTRLRRVNGNAAGTGGDVASPHLTGQAIDFGKHGMTTAQIAWMRLYLLPLMQSGQVDVEEEFQQACFHISVYRNYDSAQGTRRRVLATNEAAPMHDDLNR